MDSMTAQPRKRQATCNAQRWELGLRIVAGIVGLVAIGCIAWTTATGPHAQDHYVWDWQEVPWNLLPVGAVNYVLFNHTNF